MSNKEKLTIKQSGLSVWVGVVRHSRGRAVYAYEVLNEWPGCMELNEWPTSLGSASSGKEGDFNRSDALKAGRAARRGFVAKLNKK